MFETVIFAVANALHVPLYPAPARLADTPCAIYRYYPGASDGAMREDRLVVRVFAERAAICAEELDCVRRALVTDGDLGCVTEDASVGAVADASGGGSGYVARSGLSYMQSSFILRSHGDG